MKYFDALKIYNQGKPAWCSPRKDTVDYKAVIAIMKKTSGTLSKESSPKSSKSSKSSLSNKGGIVLKKPSSKSLLFKNANIIQRFLKNKLIITKNNLDTRVRRYHLIKKHLANIKSNKCLSKKMFGNNKGFTIDGIVNLEKKIGSDSVYGTIYLTSIPNLLGTYPIASKLMKITANNECETKMNTWITENLIIPKKTKHFVIMYKTTKCKSSESTGKELLIQERLVNYNELCNSDLSSLMKTDEKNDEMLMINMAYQVFIAIATYHNRVGYCHRDCHHGNFLYQLNNEVGYYHYIYNGFDFYIKSCKYNMCIFDFGISDSISNVDKQFIFNDYYNIIHGFVSNKTNGWIEGNIVNAKVNAGMFMIMTKIQRILPNFLKEPGSDMFQNIIDNIFKVFKPETEIFITTKPNIILNKKPFIINKVEQYPNINFKKVYL
jgi:hypothetical protein